MPDIGCDPCASIARGETALCVEHKRAQVGPDAPPEMAELIYAAAHFKRIEVSVLEGAHPETQGPPPAAAAISVDVVEHNGRRIVQLVMPAGAESVAIALTPDVAEALAHTLAKQARIARSPGGLILPGS